MSALTGSERIAVFAVLAAMAIAVLDGGIVNMALPTLAREIDADAEGILLVVGAYQAANLMGLLPCAHFGERFGYRRTFSAGVILFCAASACCSIAPNLAILTTARFIQGLGAAAIMALGVALLRAALGTERLGSAIAWNALTVALCSAIGPSLGALVLSFGSARTIFLTTVPIGTAALLASLWLPQVPATRRTTELGSIVLYGIVIASTVVAVRIAPELPISALLFAGAAAAFAVLLARRARAGKATMFPTDLLAIRPIALQATASVSCFVAQSMGFLALPFLLQSAMGQGLLVSGSVITCWPIAVAIASMTVDRVFANRTTAAQCAWGALVLAFGLAIPAATPMQNSPLLVAAGASLCGVGFGLFQLANNRAIFGAAPANRSAAAGGIQGSARLIGQTTGVLISTLIDSFFPAGDAPRICMAIGAAFSGLAAVLASRAQSPARSSKATPCAPYT